VKTTNGSALTSSVSNSSQTSPQTRVGEIVGLMLLGVVAVAVHAAGRNRFELAPGHQGLTWIALLMVGRLTSSIRWAGIASATGAAGATFLPIWRLGDPFLGLSYAAACLITDLGLGGFRSRLAPIWLVALIGGLAHSAKPLIRSIVRLSGWQYDSLLSGLPYPMTTHFLFGVAGALVGVGFLYVSGQRVSRPTD
jgi:hypothetical protein